MDHELFDVFQRTPNHRKISYPDRHRNAERQERVEATLDRRRKRHLETMSKVVTAGGWEFLQWPGNWLSASNESPVILRLRRFAARSPVAARLRRQCATRFSTHQSRYAYPYSDKVIAITRRTMAKYDWRAPSGGRSRGHDDALCPACKEPR